VRTVFGCFYIIINVARNLLDHLDIITNFICELLRLIEIAVDIVDDLFNCGHIAIDVMGELLRSRYVAVNIVDNLFNRRHVVTDMLSHFQIPRRSHQSLVFCQNVQTLKSILDVCPSRHPLQYRFCPIVSEQNYIKLMNSLIRLSFIVFVERAIIERICAIIFPSNPVISVVSAIRV
jgi:hypothetical protein